MNWLIGIIGYPIRHSISPVFQQAALDYCSIDARYQAWEVMPHDLPAFLQRLRAPNFLGINVTVPHKETVMPWLDSIDDWARLAGAVNTVVHNGAKLNGYNTDSEGFMRALKEDAHFSAVGCEVLILGAGGSARGVALALAHEKVGSITFANRTLQRAERLAELVRRQGLKVEVIPLDEAALAQAASVSQLIVNCTTLGMKHGPDEERSLLTAQHIPSGALVYDLVYNPPETPLLHEAKKAGAFTLGGLPMLVYQGAASFELWTGRKAPVEVMMKVAKEALERRPT